MKVFICFTPTDHPHRMKVFASLFSKSDRGLGAEPQVAPAGAKLLIWPFFGSFFGLLLQRKNGEDFLNATRPNLLPAFFFDTSGARKKLGKKETPISGLCPVPRSLFEKSDAKTFVEVI